MSFRPKKIFIADDNHEYRQKVKDALVNAGHEVLLEAKSGEEALQLVPQAVELGVEVLVTDGYMPNRGDGAMLAEELNKLNKELLVVSVSDGFLGRWNDPNFDTDKPYSTDLPTFDIHGRSKDRQPDLTSQQVDWSTGELAKRIGEMEFSLISSSGLEAAGWFAGVGKERGN